MWNPSLGSGVGVLVPGGEATSGGGIHFLRWGLAGRSLWGMPLEGSLSLVPCCFCFLASVVGTPLLHPTLLTWPYHRPRAVKEASQELTSPNHEPRWTLPPSKMFSQVLSRGQETNTLNKWGNPNKPDMGKQGFTSNITDIQRVTRNRQRGLHQLTGKPRKG